MGKHSSKQNQRQQVDSSHRTRKVSLFGRKDEILHLRNENDDLKRQLDELGVLSVTEREKLEENLDHQIDERRSRLLDLDDKTAASEKNLHDLEAQTVDIIDKNALQEVGFYDYENPAEDSVALGGRLAAIRQEQKRMVHDHEAICVTTGFTFNGSNAKGRTFLNDMSRMALSLFNAEAENCVKNVKAGNLQSSMQRLARCADRIARFGKFIQLYVAADYYQMRIEELELTSQYMQALQAEKEAERERKAELREQRKAQQELDAEMSRLKKEQEHYLNVLARMKESGDMEKAAELEKHLQDIDKSIKDVDYRAANVRAGYVYVISDIGAFGKNMVKIGMTRRLNPMDRVRELSDASVPFKFDVHALFFSKDAVTLETMLHHEFESRRVNKVNARKEFYRCTPQEVLDKLREKNVAVVEYHTEPAAEEYRISQEIDGNTPTGENDGQAKQI